MVKTCVLQSAFPDGNIFCNCSTLKPRKETLYNLYSDAPVLLNACCLSLQICLCLSVSLAYAMLSYV